MPAENYRLVLSQQRMQDCLIGSAGGSVRGGDKCSKKTYFFFFISRYTNYFWRCVYVSIVALEENPREPWPPQLT